MSARILVIEHQDDAPAGGVGRWLAESGNDFELVRADQPLPAPDRWDALVCLGSRESAYDASVPWIEAERNFLTAADAHGAKILGICFGAQQLATIFGGSVQRAPLAERGWIEVTGDAPYAGPWFAWHRDHIIAPQQARIHARTDRAVQAFSIGRHVGVQFHPEIGAPLIRDWMQSADRVADLAESGAQPAAVLTDTDRYGAAARRGADALFRSFFASP